MCAIDSGLWCWDATTQSASDDAPSQRRGWRGLLSFSFEVRMRQGRVTLPYKSLRGVRAPNTLLDTVTTLQRPGLKGSTLFLDIKGGFDNVNASILCSSRKKAGVPLYRVALIALFLAQRTCPLLFQALPKTFSPVQVGTPEGSLISSVLFIIYVVWRHCISTS